MTNPTLSLKGMTRHPSAFLPMAMSLAAMGAVLVSVAIYGAVRGTDEGATAHIWQLLMVGQMPVVAFFAIKWLPRQPKSALLVLMLQLGAVLAALAPVFLLHL